MTELKSQNEAQLTVLLLITLVPFYLAVVVLHQDSLWILINSNPWKAFVALATIGLGPVVCLRAVLRLGVNNVSTRWKERLAHLRWNHPLPGGRANVLIQSDSRIDVSSLSPEIEALLDESMTPRERNAYWYNHIFRPVRDSVAVSNSHRRYLLYREASAGAFIIFWMTAIFDLLGRTIYDFPLMTLSAYFFSAIYILLLIGAANQAGKRMVTGAIANYTKTQFQGDAQ
tara:strand:- start:22206 stop:22892 length:687 start_codon:yes stop_codon:yes gene_type:complete